MRWQRTFSSRIERRVVLPLAFALGILVLGITSLAMDQIRNQAVNNAETNLRRMAKDYGMLIAERLRDRVAYNRFWEDGGKPQLEWRNDDGIFVVRGVLNGQPVVRQVSLAALTHDLAEVTSVTRCAHIVTQPPCTNGAPDDLVRTWTLRLVSLFETDTAIVVTVRQPRSIAVQGIDSIASMLPYFVTLFAAIVGYVVALHLRRRFKPVPTLSCAIQKIESGDFEHRVDIDTNDEFSELGAALNSLSSKLGSSFGFLRSLSEIDQMILSNASMDGIIDSTCRTAIEYAFVPTALIALVNDEQIELRGFMQNQPYESRVAHRATASIAYPQVTGIDKPHYFPLFRDRDVAGWLVVDGDGKRERLVELARKISVGLTTASRSESLFKQATYDSLTGLLNRLSFGHQLSARLQQSTRSGQSGALLFLDLDDFKSINDVHGHSAGDELLCVVADRLADCLRDSDMVARFGGDEFAISLSPLDDTHTVTALLRRIIEAVSRPIQIGRFEHVIQCSIGVCLYPEDGKDTETLLRNADVAMYRAKAISGSTFVFFNQTLNAETKRRVILERRLRNALRDKRLDVHLQPKMHIATKVIDSFEALIRWHDDELGHVAPSEFVDIAERAGLIGELTECVIAQTAHILAKYPTIRAIAINVSPVMLAQAQFVERFLQTLRDYDCDPQRLEVEVTESVFMHDPASVTTKLERLKMAGLRVSLDDFGTGFSSLNLLRQLPLDALKIDKSFIDDLPTNEQAMLLVSKIIEIANGLDIEVVAEGIESMAQLRAIDSMGCSHAQGFLISKPRQTDEIMQSVGTGVHQPMELIA